MSSMTYKDKKRKASQLLIRMVTACHRNSHHTVLHIIGSLFYTCSLFCHIPLRYLTGFLYIPM